MSDPNASVQAAAEKIGLADSTRHVFLCVGPSCCTPEVGQAAWDKLKQALRDAGLSSGDHVCQRTKAGCLRICTGGPTMVVYPEGTWYSGMTADRIERLVQEHLVEGRPVAEWVFAAKILTPVVIEQPEKAMAQVPTVIGVLVCEQAVIEERTHNVTLGNCFTRRNIPSFPSEQQRFVVFAALTDGLGEIELKLVIERLDSQEDVYHEARVLGFGDRLQEVRFLFRVTTCSFPAPGEYDVILFAGSSELARHRIKTG